MIPTIKRLRIKMLSWLFFPVVLVILLSTQLIRTVETYASNPDTSATKQLTEADIATTIPPLPPFEYKNTGLVTLWFDDAWESQYTIAVPTLEKYGFKGALAVPTKAVDTYNYMTWLQVKRVQHMGWEIDSHSQTHNCSMQYADQVLVNKELIDAKRDLEKRGLRSDLYVTPCGVGSPLIYKTARAAYPMGLRTSEPGLNAIPVRYSYDIMAMAVTHKTTKKDVEIWLSQAKQQKKWLILIFHRVDNPKEEYDTDQKRFEQMIAAVKESGLPVVLPAQVLSLKGTGKGIPPIDVSIDDNPTDEVPLNESFDTDSENDTNDTSDETPEPTETPEPLQSAITPTVNPSTIPTPSPTNTASSSAE